MKHLAYINKYFYKYRKQLILGVLITIIARLFSLVMPKSVQYAIKVVEDYMESPNKEANIGNTLLLYSLLIITAVILSGFFTFWMRQLIINVSRYIEFDMKNEIYQKYQTLSQRFYKQNRTGDLMNRISEDVGKVRMYTGPALMYSVQTITLFLCSIPLMFYTSTTLATYALLPLPILAFLVYFISRKINQKTIEVQKFLSDISSFSQETFSGIHTIKAFVMEEETQKNVDKISQEGRKKHLALLRIEAWFFPIMIFLIGISIIFVIFVGGRLYINGEIQSIGVITEFTIYVMMLTWPVATVGWVSNIVQQAEASQGRINEFLNEKSDIETTIQYSTPIQGDIRFENVTFTYPDTQITALKEVSFHIPQGKNIAIIGRTGSGKSTILDLITRMYDVQQGHIFIDGRDVRSLNLNDLRKAISVIPQDSFLFSDTIGNNIKYGKSEATQEEIIAVAKLAQVHDNIMDFKDGYETILGERGISLSGGQRQRVSIARALLKEAQIYLFDDCLSAVDTDTEEKILHNLTQIAYNTTRIIVSHRVSVARNADSILFLDNGKLIGQGTHQELYENNQEYRNYYDTQVIE
ncbi:ABC transporter ATP-binding protein [uncultured Capnocytophaga sp.]|jgi:ABC-type multidrug/protein/lipid transporter ATP-binding and permease component|uniref:ABC transporter ATP-binding protein n=1 Tax=uncultured Capnocytophaga sp. TaxID=159273 RepID=UPI0026174E55|nr:ABC transporter ATP-binding protein [uncultured Capnocytophaga sp.]